MSMYMVTILVCRCLANWFYAICDEVKTRQSSSWLTHQHSYCYALPTGRRPLCFGKMLVLDPIFFLNIPQSNEGSLNLFK